VHEHYDVVPDIMVTAQGIANGFPLSGFIARDEIADSFQPGDLLTTFGGNPVSCAASLAKIKAAVREAGAMIGVGGSGGNVLRIQPPLTISDDELKAVVAIMVKVMET